MEYVDCALTTNTNDRSLSCNFDANFCYYYQDITSDFQWQREQKAQYGDTGPYADHTGNDGFFAYMPSYYPQETGQKARLHSSLQTSINQNICIRFWYFMFGKKLDRLNLYLDQYKTTNINGNFTRRLVWSKFGTQGRKWFEGRLTINSNLPWKITYEGIVGQEYSSDIALDDLDSYVGECAPTKLCNFEANFCEFKNTYDGVADINWLRGMPPNSSFTDHTTNSYFGSFAYIDFKNGNVNSKARLVSANYFPNGIECLQFWYLNNGLNSSKLNIYEKKQSNYGQAIWSKLSHENQLDWRFGEIDIGKSATGEYSIVFEGVKLKNDDKAIVAIDDLIIKIGECPKPIDCNFEDFNLCSWSQYKDNDLDWELSQGIFNYVGPDVDVTLGTDEGVYIYIDSNYPSKENDKARLMSDFIDPIDNGCFGVWYYMGKWADDAYFNVYMDDRVNGYKILNSINGSQGEAWFHLLLNVSNSYEFNLIVEGVIGDDFTSDLALDELTYSKTSCGQSSNEPSTTQISTTAYPATSLDCSFECNCVCQWQYDTTGEYNWTLNKGSTPNGLTGPSTDHTTDSQDGYYLYVKSILIDSSNSSAARIISPPSKIKSNGGCFKFFYHMYGSDVDKLNIYLREASSNDNGKPIWQKYGNKGDKWLFGHVYVEADSSETDFKFIIEATV